MKVINFQVLEKPSCFHKKQITECDEKDRKSFNKKSDDDDNKIFFFMKSMS